MTKLQERQQALKDSLDQRVLVIDGAMGTMIHEAPLAIETDYQGRENCPEILVFGLTGPARCIARRVAAPIRRMASTATAPTTPQPESAPP